MDLERGLCSIYYKKVLNACIATACWPQLHQCSTSEFYAFLESLGNVNSIFTANGATATAVLRSTLLRSLIQVRQRWACVP